MKKRPTSVTVISWILIIMGGISLITRAIMFNNAMALELMSKNPIPIPIQHAMTYAGILIMLISGIAMLKGQNWARFLYVIWSVIGFLIGIATSPMKVALIPSFVLLLVVAFFLFRPKVNEFFHERRY
nr:hypothetical protein [uncultured Desulfobacter sp.]